MLSKIFIFVAFNNPHQSNYSSGTAEWIKSTSHICQHWRDVALGCPSLWAGILFEQPSWVEEMLKRSKMVPLVLKGNITNPKTAGRIRLALSHSRTRELHVLGTKSTLESLFSIPSQNAPFLESLCLSNYEGYSFSSLGSGYMVSEDAFHDTTRLRRLELVRCNISWDSTLLAGLNHLLLHKLTLLPTTKQLIDVLGNMLDLETLDLDNSLPADVLTPPPPDRTINLPRLTLISLTSGLLECANVLNHLAFPRDASMSLSCTVKEIPDNYVSILVPALSRIHKDSHALRVSEDSFRCLAIRVDPGPIQILDLWTQSSGPCDRPIPSTARIHLYIKWETYRAQSSSAQVVVQLCNALPLAYLDTIHIYDLDIPTTNWLSTFGGLAHLVNIDVKQSSAWGLVDALMPVVNPEVQDGLGKDSTSMETTDIIASAGVFFPALETLVLRDVAFSSEGDEDMSVDDLQDCLIGRYECRAEIQRLYLFDCFSLQNEEVNLLREITVDVRWDGVVQFIHEESEVEDHSDDEYFGYQGSDNSG